MPNTFPYMNVCQESCIQCTSNCPVSPLIYFIIRWPLRLKICRVTVEIIKKVNRIIGIPDIGQKN
jgi:hypothetical protein